MRIYYLKLEETQRSLSGANVGGVSTLDDPASTKHKKKLSVESVKTSILYFQKSFSMSKVDVGFSHRGQDLSVYNSIMGINLSSSKSKTDESTDEETSHLDVLLNFDGIHLFKGGEISVIEVLKVSFNASVDAPMQENTPIRIVAGSRIGGTHLNVILSRLGPWLKLCSAKEKMVLPEEIPSQEMSQQSESRNVLWTCAVSAPEFIVVIYSLNELPLYRGCFQSCNLSASNLATKGIQMHTKLSELVFLIEDGYTAQSNHNLLGKEVKAGSLMHINQLNIDWGHKEMQSHEKDHSQSCKIVLSIDVTGMGVFLSFKQVESLISTMLSFKTLLKGLLPSDRKVAQSKMTVLNKKASKGTRIIKVNFDNFIMKFRGNMTLEEMSVADPKSINFGSQGGQVIITESSDGTTRTAKVLSNLPSGCNHVKFTTSVEFFCLCLSINKEKESTQIALEQGRSFYEEVTEEEIMGAKITLFDIKKTKFVRRAVGTTDAVRALFSAADIAVRWEPDVHLALYEIATRLKFLVESKKHQDSDSKIKEASFLVKDTVPDKAIMDAVQSEKQTRKKDSIFAVDVENLGLSAELADGVESKLQVSSIFSENAKIGVLLEGLMLSFNEATVLKSGRLQVSSVPVSVNVSVDPKAQPPTARDWVIQGLDLHILFPYRLQLRAIDDAVEEMFRGLKLVTAALSTIAFPIKKVSSPKKKPGTSKLGCLRLIIRRLVADIEEEPLQGWLDEHYHLLKNEVCELNTRLKFLDEAVSAESKISETSELYPKDMFLDNGTEIKIGDTSVQLLREELYKKAFKSYYEACQKLILSKGSGACSTGFQSGFKPSTARASFFSVSATDLDVNLSKINGGDREMIDFIYKMDPFSLQGNIPFSRLYGTDLLLNTGSLSVKLRDYTFPMFAGNSGKCQGRVVLAQQATCFQPQVQQDVFIGKWRRVRMFRSVSGTTPAMKSYLDLPISFHKGEVSYGVGYEPVFTDLSYAFTVALRRADLSLRSLNQNLNVLKVIPPPKKERSLPWWDDMRYYIHGRIGLFLSNIEVNVLATSDPYEKQDKLQIVSQEMDILHTDGQVKVSAKDFRVYTSSIHSLLKNNRIDIPNGTAIPFLNCPAFCIDVIMEWECESGNPPNHYLHALPNDGVPREKVYDPFRSLSLSLRWNFSLGSQPSCDKHASLNMGDLLPGKIDNEFSEKLEVISVDFPTFNFGVHDMVWLTKWWNMVYLPPQKIRTFSRWPRFGVPRVPRSGNLSLDKVMTEFCLGIDSTPTYIKHLPLRDDDPTKFLTFKISKLKCELCWSRGKQKFTFDCKRELLDLVYHGVDLHLLNVYLNKDMQRSVQKINSSISQSVVVQNVNDEKCSLKGGVGKDQDDGFLLHSDYFTVRRQTPKADGARLSAWQEAGRKKLDITELKYKDGNDSDNENVQSDPSDDDGFNVIIADSCQRIFVYGLKLLWTLEIRDVVWSWATGLSKAFETPKPSPSRQYAQKKLLDRQKAVEESKDTITSDNSSDAFQSLQDAEVLEKLPCTSQEKYEHSDDAEDEGKGQFMINVVQPQFNLHSEDAHGRFLLAAASGRVLARSFHSVLHLGGELLEKALGTDNVKVPDAVPEMTWKRVELSFMLEHVQAHVAPTDVDPGAGIQWLPKIHRSSRKVKRTGALLERVFMPCQMYFRYTRHRSLTTDLNVKPLKELSFNSPDITATMSSRQFQVMLDVLSNLLFSRLPKVQKNCLSYPSEEDDIEEEADEMIPYGIEEVDLSRINLERVARERKLLLDDIRKLSGDSDGTFDPPAYQGTGVTGLWMISGGKPELVHWLKLELANKHLTRRAAYSELRIALQKAAQLRLMEKEKNKSPSYAMRISMRINKVVWSMLEEGKPFAEVEINDLAYDFDRDFKDIGLARFTIKSFVVRNDLPNAKSIALLSAWNAPPEWGKNNMLHVNAKQGTPKDGRSPIEHFQVDIYPLRIHLTESMYRMMWHYFFPEDEQDPQRRQELWKVSTTAGLRKGKKGSSASDAAFSVSQFTKDVEVPERQNATKVITKVDNLKGNIQRGPELRRTSSFDKTWEESVAESVANELVMNAHSSRTFPTKDGALSSTLEQPVIETSRTKPKDAKLVKTGRLVQEEKKVGKFVEEKRARPVKLTEFHNVKISQVELLLTYEGSRFPINDLRLLMDTFHREEFVGTWGRLFSRIKKHVIWGVLKSVTGMQGKKFKVKSLNQKDAQGSNVLTSNLNLSDSDGQSGESDQLPIQFLKRQGDGAGDGFVVSIRGLFNTQRRKAKAFVLRTMRGDVESELHGEWSEGDVEISPFARQLTITKAKKLIRRHTKKFHSKVQKSSDMELPEQESPEHESPPSSPKEEIIFLSDDSSDASSSKDPNEEAFEVDRDFQVTS
ncbi:hypothetical protein HPP92_018503 [Vanilla planifolia]|uniref:FMP27/BLTP2/Hobbit GFWDK motif-containing RBG unit domain-containing protein n=1 Tax=Vanilla planifolia TaxID=51239 RepID=A0A835QDN8_VANPL|nr:hypothetical protein HPP92_018503 [Vanilla planifolia]